MKSERLEGASRMADAPARLLGNQKWKLGSKMKNEKSSPNTNFSFFIIHFWQVLGSSAPRDTCRGTVGYPKVSLGQWVQKCQKKMDSAYDYSLLIFHYWKALGTSAPRGTCRDTLGYHKVSLGNLVQKWKMKNGPKNAITHFSFFIFEKYWVPLRPGAPAGVSWCTPRSHG